jgi:hypothetical protein
VHLRIVFESFLLQELIDFSAQQKVNQAVVFFGDLVVPSLESVY